MPRVRETIRVGINYSDGVHSMYDPREYSFAGGPLERAKWEAENTVEIGLDEWNAYCTHMVVDRMWQQKMLEYSNRIFEITHKNRLDELRGGSREAAT